MTQCHDAVILAAGRGSRMQRDQGDVTLNAAQREAASHGIKAMIPDSAGRPFLDHVLASLADAGISRVVLVIGPAHDVIREHYAEHPPTRLQLAFATQREPTGTATALLDAEPQVGSGDFLVLNSDNLYPVPAMRALVQLDGPGLVGFDRQSLVRESNIDADRIGAFAAITIRDDGTLAKIVEKPGTTGADWISMNLWRFDQEIFAACRAVPLSPRGEYELPVAVSHAVDSGMRLQVVRFHGGVLDLSNRGDIAPVAAQLGKAELQL